MSKGGNWSKVGNVIVDGAFAVVDTAVVGAQGARNAVSSAVGTAMDATGNAIDHAAAAATGVGGTVADATNSAAGVAARPFENSPAAKKAAKPIVRAAKTIKRRYGNVVSPAVVGQGGDFGSLAAGQDPVILRIEVADSSDVKTMRRFSYIVAIFAILATVSIPALNMKNRILNYIIILLQFKSPFSPGPSVAHCLFPLCCLRLHWLLLNTRRMPTRY
jgi:hypothetical protein